MDRNVMHPQYYTALKLIPYELTHSSSDPLRIIPCLDSCESLDCGKIILMMVSEC